MPRAPGFVQRHKSLVDQQDVQLLFFHYLGNVQVLVIVIGSGPCASAKNESAATFTP
jgi:hypothetical protein